MLRGKPRFDAKSPISWGGRTPGLLLDCYSATVQNCHRLIGVVQSEYDQDRSSSETFAVPDRGPSTVVFPPVNRVNLSATRTSRSAAVNRRSPSFKAAAQTNARHGDQLVQFLNPAVTAAHHTMFNNAHYGIRTTADGHPDQNQQNYRCGPTAHRIITYQRASSS